MSSIGDVVRNGQAARILLRPEGLRAGSSSQPAAEDVKSSSFRCSMIESLGFHAWGRIKMEDSVSWPTVPHYCDDPSESSHRHGRARAALEVPQGEHGPLQGYTMAIEAWRGGADLPSSGCVRETYLLPSTRIIHVSNRDINEHLYSENGCSGTRILQGRPCT